VEPVQVAKVGQQEGIGQRVRRENVRSILAEVAVVAQNVATYHVDGADLGRTPLARWSTTIHLGQNDAKHKGVLFQDVRLTHSVGQSQILTTEATHPLGHGTWAFQQQIFFLVAVE
jgi:hypothetical protein